MYTKQQLEATKEWIEDVQTAEKSDFTPEEIRANAPMYKGAIKNFNIAKFAQIFKEKNPALYSETSPKPERRNSDPYRIINRPLWKDSIFGPPKVFYAYTPSNDTEMEPLVSEVQEQSETLFMALAASIVSIVPTQVQLCQALPNSEPLNKPKDHNVDITFVGPEGYIATMSPGKKPETEMLTPCADETSSGDLDSHKVVMRKSEGDFKIEDAPNFKFNYRDYPDVIDGIFKYLTCEEQFNMRLAFNNLDKLSERPPIISAVTAKCDVKIKDVAARKCICDTYTFCDPSVIRENGKLARVIYNQMLSLQPTKDARVEVTINDKYRGRHTPQMQYHYTSLAYQYTRVPIQAWIYKPKDMRLKCVATLKTEDLPPVRSKRLRAVFHPHSERWKDERHWFF